MNMRSAQTSTGSITRPRLVGLTSATQCHRCLGDLLCTAEVPHTFLRADGQRVGGTRMVGLCPGCDRDRPGASEVIAYFADHGVVRPESVTRLGALLADWLVEIGPATLDDEEFEELWRAGELDQG